MAVDFGMVQSELAGGPQWIKNDIATEVLKGAKALGASRIRMLCPWDMIQTNRGQYFWDDFDRALEQCAKYGLRPLAVLTVGPNWLGFPNMPWTGSTAQDYGDFAHALATRHGPSGTNLLSDYEIWNEANSVVYFPQALDVPTYVQYLKQAFNGIKAADPAGSTVLSTGVMPIGTGQFTLEPNEFIRRMYAAGGGQFCDAVGYHWYTQDLQFHWVEPTVDSPFWTRLLDVRNIMVGAGDGAKKIWPTEVGVPYPTIPSLVTCKDWLKTQIDRMLLQDWLGPFFIYGYKNTAVTPAGALGPSSMFDQFGVVDAAFATKQPLRDYVATIAGIDVAGGDITPPTAPTALHATAETTSAITLAWTASTDDVGVVGYHVRRDGVKITDTPVNALTYTDDDLAENTEYAYTVTALDARGNESEASNLLQHMTDSSAGGGLVQEFFSYDFTADPSHTPTDLFTAFGLGVTVSGGVAETNFDTVEGTKWSGMIYDTDQASADHSAVVQVAPGGRYQVSAERSIMPIARAKPDGSQWMAATSHWGGSNSCQLLMKNSSGETPVVVYSAPADLIVDGDQLELAADGDTYVVSVLKAGWGSKIELLRWTDTTHIYKGRLNRRTGFGFQHIRSGGINYGTPKISGVWKGYDLRPVEPDTVPPSAPTSFTVTSVTSTTATMTWAAATDDVAVIGYNVYRGAVKVNTDPIDGLSYTDEGLAAATGYTWHATAVDWAGNESVASNTDSDTTAAASAAVTFDAVGAGARETFGDGVISWSHVVGAGSNRGLVVAIAISHPNWGGFDQYEQLTVKSTVGGVDTYFDLKVSADIGPLFQYQGSVHLFYLDDPAVATHTITCRVVKSFWPYAAFAGNSASWKNVGAVENVIATTSGGTAPLNLTVASDPDDVAVVAATFLSTPTGFDGTTRYSAGNAGDCTGYAKFIKFGDKPGGTTDPTFITTSSDWHGAVGMNLKKAA